MGLCKVGAPTTIHDRKAGATLFNHLVTGTRISSNALLCTAKLPQKIRGGLAAGLFRYGYCLPIWALPFSFATRSGIGLAGNV